MILCMAAILLGLLLLECVLRGAAAIGLRVDALAPPIPRRIDDVIMGTRGNKEFPEHDARGFRNEEVPVSVNLLAMGDSHTYGWNVKAQEAWPWLVAQATSASIYNQGMGGFGPMHTLEILPEALEMHPKAVIFGLYFGNDFVDSFDFAARNNRLSLWLESEQAKRVAEIEGRGRIYDEISGLLEETIGINARSHRYLHGGNNVIYRTKKWIAENIYLYRVLQSARAAMFPSPVTTFMVSGEFEELERRVNAGPYDDRLIAFDDGKWSTILTPAYRVATMDQREPRVAASVALVENVLVEMNEMVRATGASFCIVLLPTKEAVFYQHAAVSEQGIQQGVMKRLAQIEIGLMERLIGVFDLHGIPYVAPFDELYRASVQPYPHTADGHPNAEGNRIVAHAILSHRKTCIPGL